MITNVDGTISTTVVDVFDSMYIEDFYILFKTGDYSYALASGAKDDFSISSSSITGTDLDIVSYERYETATGYNSYYFLDTYTDDISVNFDSTIIYSNLVDYTPRLSGTEERSVEIVQAFISFSFFLFFTICIIFHLFGSLRFRVERRNDR